MHDWKKIEKYIMNNVGKYTKTQICEKFNIKQMSTLSNHIRENCPELNKCFARQYDWSEIDRFIMDNAGKYTKTQICEKFNIKELSVLTRHIQRSCPELENYITKGFKEYDWKEIEKYIMDNAGKYTRRQICEKFNITKMAVLNNYIRENYPELKKYFKIERMKYDWSEIDQFIMDNNGKYTKTY